MERVSSSQAVVAPMNITHPPHDGQNSKLTTRNSDVTLSSAGQKQVARNGTLLARNTRYGTGFESLAVPFD